MALSDELKLAITYLPDSEKNKLLFRYIAKDDKMIRRLTFELLEKGETIENRIQKVYALIDKELPTTEKFYSPGYLLMDMRSINARITEHAQATKDSVGEIQLTVYMLAEAFRRHGLALGGFSRDRCFTFSSYIIKRIQIIEKKIKKMSPEQQRIFIHELNELMDYVWTFEHTEKLAKSEKLSRSF